MVTILGMTTPTIICLFKRNLPCGVKLKSGGKSLPLGILAPGWRSSSKNGWAQASIVFNREEGLYSNSLLTKSMASGGVLGRNTYDKNREKILSESVCLPPLSHVLSCSHTHLAPRVSFDLRKFELRVIGVHLSNLFFCWGT